MTETPVENVTAPNGKVWRVNRVILQDGTFATGNTAWRACTGAAAYSKQWKFGPTREAVVARVMAEET